MTTGRINQVAFLYDADAARPVPRKGPTRSRAVIRFRSSLKSRTLGIKGSTTRPPFDNFLNPRLQATGQIPVNNDALTTIACGIRTQLHGNQGYPVRDRGEI